VFTLIDNNYTTTPGTGTVDVTVIVNKATPPYTEPKNLTAIYGQTLADVGLPDGWAWDASATDVGSIGTHTFPATFTPSDTINYDTVQLSLNVKVRAIPVAKPKIVTGLVYNDGTEKTGVVYDAALIGVSYALTGDVTGTEMGTYTARFTLLANYEWADGTTDPLVLEWRIAEKEGHAEMVMNGFVYDGTTGSPSIAAATKVGDWVSMVYEYSTDGTVWNSTAPADAGTYHVRAVLTGSASGEYADLTTDPVRYTISKASGNSNVTMGDLILGGQWTDPVVPGMPSEYGVPTIEYKIRGEDDTTYTEVRPTDAGHYTVRVSFAATANYNEYVVTADFAISAEGAGGDGGGSGGIVIVAAAAVAIIGIIAGAYYVLFIRRP
jgi:hypothetical protein